MISAVQLHHAFGDHQALRAVSFRVAKGEFAFITGHSGAGKTTLMRILHGELPVQRGKARIAGYDLAALRKNQLPFLRREVALIFQDFKILMDRSATDNISLPLEVAGMPRDQIKRRVDSVLASLNLGRIANLACASLSGGEQQLVATARAMASGPKVILADEPTGNLDWDMAQRLLEVFKQFHAHGSTILMATHNQDLVRSTPQARVLSLESGLLLNGGDDIQEDE
ncbi:MAG: ATP-binding cassette domain-containing protein [Desulfovibrio sp.]|nr:ATP-binding cassette domain-containing protein [Desulfovibrio sp.]MBI4959595.1 ATP-binding cassette domain-containing protein [Desulfovibrio sp.]